MAVTQQQVAELYVATFNRAPDAAGLAYWVNDSGLTIEQIAQSFFDQPETQTKYPEGTTDEAFVTAVYENLFNRAPDADGLAYWTGDSGLGGSMTRSVMIEAMKNGAQGDDAEIIANKAEVGLYYVEQGLEGTDYSLASVTADDATVTTAKADVDNFAPKTMTLTTGTDTGADFTGGNGDDTFNASVLTANDGDTLDGGDGADTLNLETASNITSNFKASNIETVNLNALGTISVDLKNMAAVTQFNSNDAAGAVTVNNIAAATTEFGIKGSATNSLDLNYATGTLTGSADKLTVDLNGSSSTAITADTGFESVELNTTAASSLSTLTASGATNLTLSGNATLSIGASVVDSFSNYTVTNTAKVTFDDLKTIKNFDASSNTDGIVAKNNQATAGLDFGHATDAFEMATSGGLVQTGSGNDNINVDSDAVFSTGSTIVKLGAGDDKLNLSSASASGEYIYGEAGNDTIYVGSALTSSDLIDGGDGTDTVNFAAGTHSLIAKGVEAVGVNGATTVNFVSTDTATAISDSGAGAVTFGNILNGSTYSSTLAKTAGTTLNFKTGEAATIDANFTKGTGSTVTLTEAKDITLTLGAASALSTVTVDEDATSLTIAATGAMSGNADIAASSTEKLATIAITGDKAIDIANVTNLDSLTSFSMSSTGGNVDVGTFDNSGYTSADQTVTKIEATSTKGSSTIGAIDFTGATATGTGSIGAITASASGGLSTSHATIGTIGADAVGTITATSATANAVIGAITVGDDGTSTTDGTISAIKASGYLAATIGAIKADNVTSIIAESTDTTTGGAASVGAITNGDGTAEKAVIGTISVSSAKSSAAVGAIDATQVGNIALSAGTTATLGSINVDNTDGNSTTGTITATGAGKVTIGQVDVETVGDITLKSTGADVETNALTFEDAGGVAVTITAATSVEANADADAIKNTKGDLSVTATAGTTFGATNEISVSAGAAAVTDTDIVVNLSAVTGNVGTSAADQMTISNESTDAASSTIVYGGKASNFIEIDIDGGTATYQGGAGADTVTVKSGTTYTSATINAESGDDVIVGGDKADTISAGAGVDKITGGKGADTISLSETTDAKDTVVISDGLSSDTVSGFTVGAGKDIISLDESLIETAGAAVAGKTLDFVEIFDANSVANGAAMAAQTLTGAGVAADAKNVFLLDLGTTKFANADAAVDALEAGGAAALTFAGNIAASDAFVFAYENTDGNVYVAAAMFVAADDNSGAAATTAAGNLDGIDLVKMSGISDVTTMVDTNFYFEA